MQKDLKITREGRGIVFYLSEDIDHHSARALRGRIDGVIAEERPREAVLDFSEVGFMDSSGIGLIIGRAELASHYGTDVVVRGVSNEIMRIVRLSGIERIKNVYIK